MERRSFLKGLGTLMAGSLIPENPLFAQSIAASQAPVTKLLHLYNIHTGERFFEPYIINGEYQPTSLMRLCYLMRDHRQQAMWSMDLGIFDRLHALQKEFGFNRPVYLISGFRSPHTNRRLRKANFSVSENSLHMEGKAIDLRIPGIRHPTLYQWAREFHQGGLGYYPKQGYIHLDTGRSRSWVTRT